MAYIGRQLVRGQNRILDDISSSFNGSTTAFNLTVSSSSSPPASVNQLWIILGGVLQKPGTDFTVADAVLTFTTAPASTLSFWGMIQGDTSDINSPADASVTPSKIANSGDFAFPADVRFKDADASHYVGLQAPSTVSSNLVWTLPAADGSANQLLKTDGSGNLGWASDTQSNLLDEDNMSSNSATQPASQQSIKAYADTKAVLTGSTNNTITTVTGAHAIQGEANLTYDGTTLLSNADTAGLTLRDSSAYAANTGCQISFQGKDSNEATKAFAAIKGLSVSADNGQLRLQTRTGGTLYDRLTIDAAGSVGIGTDSTHTAAKGVHIKTNDSGVTSASVHRDELFIEGNDHTGITIATPNDKSGGIGFDDPDGTGRGRIQYTHSSDLMYIYTSGSPRHEFTEHHKINDGNLVIGTSGHGIDFSVTADSSATGATSGSEILDHYEEGTWTPAASFSTSGSVTCSGVTGKFTKIGNVVYIDMKFFTTDISAPSGTFTITGLPFAPMTDTFTKVGLAIGFMREWGTDMPNFRGLIGGTATISFYKQATNSATSSNVQGSDFAAGDSDNYIYGSACYVTP